MKSFLFLLSLFSLTFSFSQINNCTAPTSQIDLDINNVRARILNAGDMWWDLSNANYEIPKGSGKHILFAGAIWMGGIDLGGQLRLAAQTYRQSGSDWYAGPIDTTNATTTQVTCNEYDRHWKLKRSEVFNFIKTGVANQTILDWPGNGNTANNHSQFLAPFFDGNADGIYDPTLLDSNGKPYDYPFFDFSNSPDCANKLLGDQNIWWVFNDVGNIHNESGGIPMGVEIHAQAYAYATDDFLNDITFYNYKIINRSSSSLDSTYFGIWSDFDLGNALDDYIGCDVGINLGYCYNGYENDYGWDGYGLNPPAAGIKWLQTPKSDAGTELGMTNFHYYAGCNCPTGNPDIDINYYNYLRNYWLNGAPVTWGSFGYGGTVPTTYVFPDSSDPAHPTLWTEATAGNAPGDRRFVTSSGPFTLEPGGVEIVTSAVVWARADSGGPIASLLKVKTVAGKVQERYDNCFVVIDDTVQVTDPNDLENIQIHPNPSSSSDEINLANVPPGTLIRIYDLQGKMIFKGAANHSKIKISSRSISSSIYFIKMTFKDSEKVLKFMRIK